MHLYTERFLFALLKKECSDNTTFLNNTLSKKIKKESLINFLWTESLDHDLIYRSFRKRHLNREITSYISIWDSYPHQAAISNSPLGRIIFFGQSTFFPSWMTVGIFNMENWNSCTIVKVILVKRRLNTIISCNNYITRSHFNLYSFNKLKYTRVVRRGLMVKALACQEEGPGFESHHGKSFS